jgi:hypothetical protein
MRYLLATVFTAMAMLSSNAKERQPDGEGDPKATSCMTGEKPTDSLIPVRICYTNAQWAELKADGIIIGPDGRPVLSPNDPWNIHSQFCSRVYVGGPSNPGQPNFNVVCSNQP